MKKLVKLLGLSLMLSLGVSQMKAQTYDTGIGILVDVGEGTYVGPHIKHFFASNHAGEFGVLFGSGLTSLSFMYHYQSSFGRSGLSWYLGMGPGVHFYKGGGSTFSLAPVAGIDFKIPGAPLDLAFDWRPRFMFHRNDTDFVPGRFGIGVRVTF